MTVGEVIAELQGFYDDMYVLPLTGTMNEEGEWELGACFQFSGFGEGGLELPDGTPVLEIYLKPTAAVLGRGLVSFPEKGGQICGA
ncbi:MAG TPA: hypothetical protein VK009_11585 [Chloroflexota bacterium]|nr:hypothetical protein [Chloroflexota bacterium]